MDPPSHRSPALHPAEWALALVVSLAALWVLRPCGLRVPFWWDAGAVYAPGARWLLDHGLASARPGVFPSDLSRGHTHLFYVLTALAFRALGPGPVAGHGLVLAFAALALTWTYALGARLFHRPAGLAGAALLAASPLFLTMASETLPEVPLTALTLASVYAFARGRAVESALWGCALVLLKETGVACPLAIAGALALRAGLTRDLRGHVREFALALAPVAVLAAFFLWQRAAEGWFVLPYHAALFHERHALGGQFVRVARSMVAADGRGWAVLAAALAALSRWLHREGVFATPAPAGTDRRTVVTALGLLALANLVFFTKMFFLERYALPAHPGITLVVAGVLVPGALPVGLGRRVRTVLPVAVLALACAVGVARRRVPVGYASGEITFGYLDAVQAHQAVLRRLDTRSPSPVVLTSWPMTDELRAPWLGWVRRPYRAIDWDWYELHARSIPVDAVLAYDAVGSWRHLRDEAARLGMHPADRETVGGATVVLWVR